MKPNERQVGGNHYKSNYQHWDLVEKYQLSYIEGCITKYVTRWRKKNGIVDLEKAMHFSEKLHQTFLENKRENLSKFYKKPEGEQTAMIADIITFCRENELNNTESRIIMYCITWRGEEHIRFIINDIDYLIKKASGD